MSRYKLHHGDCLDVLRGMADNSVDAIVTDPPYGLTANKKGGSGAGGFMGLKWDSDVPPIEVWAECLRVLKPGGYLLAFAGTRTQHRMATRIEDAGFEIRDMIAWVYGSGFPKSHNGEWGGTALKPALEPITMARKPLAGTVAANWAEHGTGALNIDGCRVGADVVGWGGARGGSDDLTQSQGRNYRLGEGDARPVAGRWPANLIHDGSDEVGAAFPQAKGQQGAVTGGEPSSKTANAFGEFSGRSPMPPRGDAGSAARFFYCAKASRADRNEGLPSSDTPAVGTAATMREREDADWKARNGNHHPTVKPTDLMAYLCRLVTPVGGLVLDPFMGSGSTGKAAIREGLRFVGIEREDAYIEIARARIAAEFERANQDVDAPAAQADLFSEAA